MNVHRIGLKFYATNPNVVSLEAILPVFHRWIQESAVEGMLIDVADYAHVHHGPGVLLVAHEADYGWDLAEGRPGLQYLRKRDVPENLSEAVRSVLRPLLLACQKLTTEPEFAGLAFETGDVRLSIYDRLRLPNSAENFAAVCADVQAVLAEVYDGAAVMLENDTQDPRDPLTIRIQVAQAPPLATLAERITASTA